MVITAKRFESRQKREIANTYCGAHCTLDDLPAVIVGRLNEYATVRDDKGHDVEFSWFAVRNVMSDSNGKFHAGGKSK